MDTLQDHLAASGAALPSRAGGPAVWRHDSACAAAIVFLLVALLYVVLDRPLCLRNLTGWGVRPVSGRARIRIRCSRLGAACAVA